jgi:hypothetical protein
MGFSNMIDKLAKVEIKIGNISFSGEGDQVWLAEQLKQVMETASTAGAIRNSESDVVTPSGTAGARTREGGHVGSLASYLKTKDADSKQVRRFLATGRWLQLRGETTLTTSAVAKALADHHHKRLGNPSDCLNQNTSKGFCEKSKDGSFFITPDGLRDLGEDE